MGKISLTVAVLAIALSGCGKAVDEVGPEIPEIMEGAGGAKPVVPRPPEPPVHLPMRPVELPTPHVDLPNPAFGTLGTPGADPHPSVPLADENLVAIRGVSLSEKNEVLEYACRAYDFYRFVMASPEAKWVIIEEQFHLAPVQSHEIAEVASEIQSFISHPAWRNGLKVTPEAICLANEARDSEP